MFTQGHDPLMNKTTVKAHLFSDLFFQNQTARLINYLLPSIWTYTGELIKL